MKKKLSTVEIAQSVLERSEQVESQVRAYISRQPEQVLEAAATADALLANGKPTSALMGMPIAVKDIFCTQGVKTTCASAILQDFVPPYDATVVKRIKAEGMGITGKTNLDEFAMGSSTEYSYFGTSYNPWDLSRSPGGSSGGSAAALASGQALIAIGTDTGGSVRQPAAFTGVTGFKPTYGSVSRYGMIAFASSFDVAGIFARDCKDAAIMLEALAGIDERDSTSVAKPNLKEDVTAFAKGLAGMKLGVVKEFEAIMADDDETAQHFSDSLKQWKALGATIEEVSLPHLPYALAAYYVLAPAEASSNLGRYDGIRYGLRADGKVDLAHLYRSTREKGFGAEVKRRIMLGTFALSAGYYDAYYGKANQIRQCLREDFKQAFSKVDVMISPTTPAAAFLLGESMDNPMQMYKQDVFTLPANLVGIPGLSIPCGFTKSGLPLGLQLLGQAHHDKILLAVGHAFQQETDHHLKHPDLISG